MRDRSPGEPGKRSDEKEDQVRDSRLNGEGPGNTAVKKGKNAGLSGRPAEKTSLQVRSKEEPDWK